MCRSPSVDELSFLERLELNESKTGEGYDVEVGIGLCPVMEGSETIAALERLSPDIELGEGIATVALADASLGIPVTIFMLFFPPANLLTPNAALRLLMSDGAVHDVSGANVVVGSTELEGRSEDEGESDVENGREVDATTVRVTTTAGGSPVTMSGIESVIVTVFGSR